VINLSTIHLSPIWKRSYERPYIKTTGLIVVSMTKSVMYGIWWPLTLPKMIYDATTGDPSLHFIPLARKNIPKN
jgi:hypothetical protein